MKKYLLTAAVCTVLAVIMLCIGVSADTVASDTFGADGDILTWTLDDAGTLTIEGVGKMQDFASAQNKPWNNAAVNITSVVIGNGVTNIGAGAFEGCENLVNVTIGSDVTSIGNNAFKECGISSMIIPDGVTTIGKESFRGCNSLTSVEIPDSVVTIGERAFFGCNSLVKAEIYSRDAVFGTSVFLKTPTNFAIYGYTGSSAENYASKNGHIFVELSENSPESVLGDASGDGETNMKDVMQFARYIAGWKDYGADSVNLSVLDLNLDNKVNSIDLIILARHLANWIGYESLPYVQA